MQPLVLACVSFVLSGATQDAPAVPLDPLATLRAEAERIAALVECRGTRAFLAATRALPAVEARTVLYDAKAREAVTAEEHVRLAAAEQARFQPTEYGPEFYYTTRYGSPLAYARALDQLSISPPKFPMARCGT